MIKFPLSYCVIIVILFDVSALVDPDESKEEDEEVQRALAASMESMKESTAMAGSENKDADVAVIGQETTLAKRPTYAALPEEPKTDRSLLCRVGVRLPDGRRVQRNFLRADPIQVTNVALIYLSEFIQPYVLFGLMDDLVPI